jgi:hypothetical protein
MQPRFFAPNLDRSLSQCFSLNKGWSRRCPCNNENVLNYPVLLFPFVVLSLQFTRTDRKQYSRNSFQICFLLNLMSSSRHLDRTTAVQRKQSCTTVEDSGILLFPISPSKNFDLRDNILLLHAMTVNTMPLFSVYNWKKSLCLVKDVVWGESMNLPLSFSVTKVPCLWGSLELALKSKILLQTSEKEIPTMDFKCGIRV